MISEVEYDLNQARKLEFEEVLERFDTAKGNTFPDSIGCCAETASRALDGLRYMTTWLENHSIEEPREVVLRIERAEDYIKAAVLVLLGAMCEYEHYQAKKQAAADN
jgi:hypothetical protein